MHPVLLAVEQPEQPSATLMYRICAASSLLDRDTNLSVLSTSQALFRSGLLAGTLLRSSRWSLAAKQRSPSQLPCRLITFPSLLHCKSSDRIHNPVKTRSSNRV